MVYPPELCFSLSSFMDFWEAFKAPQVHPWPIRWSEFPLPRHPVPSVTQKNLETLAGRAKAWWGDISAHPSMLLSGGGVTVGQAQAGVENRIWATMQSRVLALGQKQEWAWLYYIFKILFQNEARTSLITSLVFCIFKMSLLVPVPNSSCPLHQDDWGLGGNAKKQI